MDSMAEIKVTFFQECEDLLEEMERGLVEMEDGSGDPETVNAVFRAVHSIKGGAGAFGLDELVKFAHVFETTLDKIRSAELEASPQVMKILLRSADTLADLVECARDDSEPNRDGISGLMGELSELAGEETQEAPETDAGGDIEFQPMVLDFDLDGDDFGIEEDATNSFVIKFTPTKELFSTANEAVVLLHRMSELGETEVECDVSGVPTLDSIDPEGSYLTWTIRLQTDQSESDIREVFEFVDGLCSLEIEADSGPGEIVADEEDSIQDVESAQVDCDVQNLEDEITPETQSSDDEEPAVAASAPALEPIANTNQAKKSPATGRATSDATIRVNLPMQITENSAKYYHKGCDHAQTS